MGRLNKFKTFLWMFFREMSSYYGRFLTSRKLHDVHHRFLGKHRILNLFQIQGRSLQQ